MARHGRRDPVEPLLDRGAPLPLGDLVGKIAHQGAGIDSAQHRRRLAHRHRARPERFHDQPDLGKFRRPLADPLRVRRIEVDDLGDKQDLPRHAALGQGPPQPFIDQPLVRRVLVNDHDPVFGLRDDVGLVHLRARRAEWPCHQRRIGRRHSSRRWRERLEGFLRGFGKPCRYRRVAFGPPVVGHRPLHPRRPRPERSDGRSGGFRR